MITGLLVTSRLVRSVVAPSRLRSGFARSTGSVVMMVLVPTKKRDGCWPVQMVRWCSPLCDSVLVTAADFHLAVP